MLKYGPKSVLIHTVPGTTFWIVSNKKMNSTPQSCLWRIVLCDPNKMTWRLISDNATDEEYQELWGELILLNISHRMKQATQLH